MPSVNKKLFKSMKLDLKDTAINRGKRLKIAYSLTGLDTTKFCAQNSFIYHNFKTWEKGTVLLKEKEATKICWALKKYNILCTKEWLLYGVGSFPTLISQYHLNQITSEIDGHKLISLEKEKFIHNTPNSFIYIVQNYELIPFYDLGDYLGCINVLLPQEELKSISNCLVKLKKDSPVVFEKMCYVDEYIVTLPKTGSLCTAIPVDSNFELIAKIVWHRKPINFNV